MANRLAGATSPYLLPAPLLAGVQRAAYRFGDDRQPWALVTASFARPRFQQGNIGGQRPGPHTFTGRHELFLGKQLQNPTDQSLAVDLVGQANPETQVVRALDVLFELIVQGAEVHQSDRRSPVWHGEWFCAAVAWRNYPPAEGTSATILNAVADLDRVRVLKQAAELRRQPGGRPGRWSGHGRRRGIARHAGMGRKQPFPADLLSGGTTGRLGCRQGEGRSPRSRNAGRHAARRAIADRASFGQISTTMRSSPLPAGSSDRTR